MSVGMHTKRGTCVWVCLSVSVWVCVFGLEDNSVGSVLSVDLKVCSKDRRPLLTLGRKCFTQGAILLVSSLILSRMSFASAGFCSYQWAPHPPVPMGFSR